MTITETTVEAPGADPKGDGARIELATVELLALVSIRRNAATDRARVLLSLPEDGLDSPVTAAGVGSLLVRRMAQVIEGRLAPQGAVNEIASILMDGEEWAEAIGTTGDASNVAALVRSRTGTVLFEPRPYDVWHVWPMPQDVPLPVIGSRLVAATFGNLPGGQSFAGSVRIISYDGTTRSAVVTVADDESWSVSSGLGGEILVSARTYPDPTFQVLASSLA
ncbi:hypothetical protein [Promicromonospora sp. NPDC057488]|uniref:hypothetical protein n=1 Tax=Promicromonospora sp. NPDC057488 TaxID=3346147 RepID=UPI0036727902